MISTLRSLLDTGDEPIEIVGALSGTLGAIFTDVGAGRLFGRRPLGKASGFTEPDPRDDLSGLDVARKALILARTIGRRSTSTRSRSRTWCRRHCGRSMCRSSWTASMSSMRSWRSARPRRGAGATLKYVATVPAEEPITVGVREVATD